MSNVRTLSEVRLDIPAELSTRCLATFSWTEILLGREHDIAIVSTSHRELRTNSRHIRIWQLPSRTDQPDHLLAALDTVFFAI